MSAEEDLDTWEKMAACCFPCGLVWLKQGTGSACVTNVCLGIFCGCCCVNICHACKYVGEQGTPGSPYNAIQQKAITSQPRL